MNDIKITKSDIREPSSSPKTVPDLATLHDELERAHLRLDYVTDCVETLLERVDNLAAKSKLSLDSHHDEISALREMVATLWDKVMPGHQEFLLRLDAIFNRNKSRDTG